MLNVPNSIKELFHTDSINKNIRIHFPNGERADICNDQIVQDTVEFTESLCSQDTIKFGLCESPVFQCEVVGVGNIKDATIRVFCEIYCDGSINGSIWQSDLEHYVYQVPYGTFVVQSCKRQADTLHRQIIAYNKMAREPLENAILQLKNKMTFSSQLPYEPNIFATLLMQSRITDNNIELLEYEKANTVNTTEPFYIFNGAMTVMVTLDFKCIHISSSNMPNLWNLRYPPISLTNEEISQECIIPLEGGGSFIWPVENYWDIIKNPGVFYSPSGGSTYGTSESFFPQKGNYIYTYQVMRDSYAQGDLYHVYVPYGMTISYHEGNYYYTHSIVFRDKDLIEIYNCDFSAVPLTLFIPRDLYRDGGYVFDSSKADFIKAFEATIELSGLFCVVRDYTLKIIDIKQQFGLTPSASLYPSSSTYPNGVTGGKLLPHDYQSCFYDDEYETPFGAIKCNYSDVNGDNCSFILYFGGFDENSPDDSYKTYDLSSNYIIKSSRWSAYRIQQFCETIADNIDGVTYMPVEFVGRGLPYVEAGDTFEILTKSNDSITTIVLKRTIKGEQHLVDSYKSV